MLLTTTPCRFSHPSADERRAVREADSDRERPVDLGRVLREQDKAGQGKVRMVYTKTIVESLTVYGD